MKKEIILKEKTESDLMKIKLEEIKKDFSSPTTYDQETRLVDDFYQIGQNKELSSEQKKEKRINAVRDLSMLYGLENSIWVASVDHEKYQPTLGQIRKKIITEYDCKTSLELMLADSIVTSYWRIIKNERHINLLMQKSDDGFSYDQLKINVLKELNRDVDLASKRMNMNIILLKEMKQPSLKVNIKTNNAFVGENQQFNNIKE